MERLGQVVVGTEVQPRHLVLDGILRRKNDDVSVFSALGQFAQQVEAAAVGQHNVEKDAVVLIDSRLRARFHERSGRFHHETCLPQRSRNHLAQFPVVFYEQNLHVFLFPKMILMIISDCKVTVFRGKRPFFSLFLD